jgi:hypothetical protein
MTLGVAKMPGVLAIGEMIWREKLENKYLPYPTKKNVSRNCVIFSLKSLYSFFKEISDIGLDPFE